MRRGTGLRKREYAKAMRYLDSMSRIKFDARFQVRLGEGDLCPEETANYLKRMVRSLSSLRADVIIYYTTGVIEVVEVKERARADAVGQLIVYSQILKKEYGTPVNMTIVCGSIHADVKDACNSLGVKVVEYDDM